VGGTGGDATYFLPAGADRHPVRSGSNLRRFVMKPVAFLDVTLSPLRTEGPDALNPSGIPGLEDVYLEELRVEWESDNGLALTREADDLYALRDAVPATGTLKHATFSFHFASSSRPGLVRIQPPDTIFLDPNCNLSLVARWALKHHFAREIAA
jgi:hypothetical protein